MFWIFVRIAYRMIWRKNLFYSYILIEHKFWIFVRIASLISKTYVLWGNKNKTSSSLHVILSIKDSLQQRIHFNSNIFGNKCCRCNMGFTVYVRSAKGCSTSSVEHYSETHTVKTTVMKQNKWLNGDLKSKHKKSINRSRRARPQTLRKHAFSNILKISPPKTENFQIKKNHISAQNINCGYSLEPPRGGGSNQYPQSMFSSKNKKNNVYPYKPQFYYI